MPNLVRGAGMYALLLFLGLISLIWNLLALPLHLLPERQGRAVGRAGIAYGYRLFWSAAQACGLMQIDDHCLDVLRNERGLIIVANHPTMLDALLLVARLPRSACIMKASLLRNIFLGSGARLARYVSNASARIMIRQAVADLRSGGQLVVFPEGTRTETPPLDTFRPSVTLISRMAQAPIQTVFIETDTPYLRKGWPIGRVPPLPIRFRLRLGRRFSPETNGNNLLAELERYYRESLEERAFDAPDACPNQNLRVPTSS
ncbi:lysophospholipid acyltransferase family protein [Variovorax dokdonensis]|uniref:Lysophospholipid acyltransferase family protein n=1 Tax=Variovorax dokdonensis TaxID=344883 RepID=A0ABT7N8U5_9BURK|nr:lysophospholipid acyltransferase family protein [Variovorax dokdonensis]MDM0044372.1 lysophospholipid acyltransferase family protein [Variovorax dokdonensis]